MASTHSILPTLATKLLGNFGLMKRSPVNGEHLMDGPWEDTRSLAANL